MLTDPVVEHIGVVHRAGGGAQLASLFIDGVAHIGEIIPGPVAGGFFQTGGFQAGRAITHCDERSRQRHSDLFAIHVTAGQDALVNGGGIHRAVLHVGGQVRQGVIGRVGGHIEIVHLDDVGHSAGGGVGGQLFKVAVPAGGGGLKVDVGVQLGVLVQDLLGVLMPGLAAPPGDPQSDVLIGRRGALRCGGGRIASGRFGSAGSCGAAAGRQTQSHRAGHGGSGGTLEQFTHV